MIEPPVDRPVRFGVVGTGGIAAAFTDDLRLLEEAEVVAVGSRSQQTADAFAAAHGVERAHSTYEGLLTDGEVDVVYVAMPQPWHHPVATRGLDPGTRPRFGVGIASLDHCVGRAGVAAKLDATN